MNRTSLFQSLDIHYITFLCLFHVFFNIFKGNFVIFEIFTSSSRLRMV